MMIVAILHSFFGIPAIVFNLSEKFIIDHHSCAARFMVMQIHETPISEFRFKIGQMFRDDMCMNVDGMQALFVFKVLQAVPLQSRISCS